MRKIISLALAYLFLGLAFIGIFLPGIPTVPFLLLSAWFATRSSPRLRRWLYQHPRFGEILVNWEQQKAVSRGSKLAAVSMMCLSWMLLYLLLGNSLLIVIVSIIFLLVSAFIVSRPEPR